MILATMILTQSARENALIEQAKQAAAARKVASTAPAMAGPSKAKPASNAQKRSFEEVKTALNMAQMSGVSGGVANPSTGMDTLLAAMIVSLINKLHHSSVLTTCLLRLRLPLRSLHAWMGVTTPVTLEQLAVNPFLPLHPTTSILMLFLRLRSRHLWRCASSLTRWLGLNRPMYDWVFFFFCNYMHGIARNDIFR